MKKVFSKFFKSSAYVTALVLAAMLWAESAAAQDNVAANLMSSAQAETELAAEINVQYNAVSQWTPGTPQYNYALTHLLYYRVILFKILEGTPVPEAVTSGLHIFDGNLQGSGPKSADKLDELGNITLTQSDVQNLYNDAVGLLTL
jgi:hypothetical protein